MLAACCDLAIGKKIVAPAPTLRIGKDFIELLPKRIEVALFLFRTHLSKE